MYKSYKTIRTSLNYYFAGIVESLFPFPRHLSSIEGFHPRPSCKRNIMNFWVSSPIRGSFTKMTHYSLAVVGFLPGTRLLSLYNVYAYRKLPCETNLIAFFKIAGLVYNRCAVDLSLQTPPKSLSKNWKVSCNQDIRDRKKGNIAVRWN